MAIRDVVATAAVGDPVPAHAVVAVGGAEVTAPPSGRARQAVPTATAQASASLVSRPRLPPVTATQSPTATTVPTTTPTPTGTPSYPSYSYPPYPYPYGCGYQCGGDGGYDPGPYGNGGDGSPGGY